MGVKQFIQKTGWFDYSVHNPFRTKKQVAEARKYAAGYGCNDAPKYSDFHKEDELLNGLRAMFEPKESTLRRFAAKTLYCFQRFIRKHSDVITPIFEPYTKEEQEAKKRIHEVDKENMKHWAEIEAANEAKLKEWETKEKARKLSERCFIYKPNRPYREH